MRRTRRPAQERILTRPRLVRILLASAVMATGTLLVLANAPGPEPQLGLPTVARTTAFVTFVFFQVFNLLNVRNDLRSVFSRGTLENRSAFVAVAAVIIVLLVLIVEMDVAHGFMTTTDLTSGRGWPASRSARPSSGRANSSRSCCGPATGTADETTSPPPERTTLRPSRPYPRPASTVRTLRCIHTGFAA